MAKLSFVKASKAQSRLRLALVGPSGSGKTFTALRIASGLGRRIAVVDTERGSASKYAGDVADFDVMELSSFAPATFAQAIRAADDAGYEVLIIDSLSHAWMGRDGALEMVDRAAKRSRENSFAAWREVTPEHNAMVDAILQSRCHVIATMRAKTEYVLEENERGKKVPRKVGLAPVQRDGLEYDFDVVADIDPDHNLIIGKTRCAQLDRKVFQNAGADVAEILKSWLSEGAPYEPPVQKLLRQIGETKERSDYDLRVAEANALRPTMTPDEQNQVRSALGAASKRLAEEAQARIEQERIAREAEEAERALSAASNETADGVEGPQFGDKMHARMSGAH